MFLFVAGGDLFVISSRHLFSPCQNIASNWKSCKSVKPLAKLAFKLSLWHLRNSKLISARLQLNRFAWFADTVPAKLNSHRKAQNSRWVESEVIYLAHKEGVKTTKLSIISTPYRTEYFTNKSCRDYVMKYKSHF